MPLLNPEFATPHFIPDLEKEYFCSSNIKSSGFTYFMALVMSGDNRPEELKEFISSGKLNPVCNIQNGQGWTALMMACRNSSRDSSERIVESLIPYCNTNLQTKEGFTALMMASRNSSRDSSEKTVEILIPHCDTNIQNNDGLTALMTACRYSSTDSSERTVDLLIPHCDTNLQNKDGFTALMIACRYSTSGSSERTVELLIPYSSMDFNTSLLSKESCILIAKLTKKINDQLKERMSDRNVFRECLKDGLSLPGSIVTSYL